MAEADKSIEDLSPPGDDEYYVEDKCCQTDNEVEITSTKDVQDVASELNKLSTGEKVENMDSAEPNIIVIAPFVMPPTVLNQQETNIKWIGIPRVTIDSVTNRVLQELKERNPQKPKWLSICAYQQFISTHDSSTIEKHLTKITRAARDSKIHKMSLVTFYFVPEEENLWEKTAQLNQHLRLMNLDNGLNPNNAHKALNYSFNKGKVCYVRFECWTERMNESGVGATLNFAGLQRYKNYILKFIHGGGFLDTEGPLVRAVSDEGCPAPLYLTKGYKGNVAMLEFIKKKGLRMPQKPAGDTRTDIQKRIDKSRSAARQLAAECREKFGDFEDEEKKTKKTGGKENIMKGKDRLDERDKKRKDDRLHQLTQEVHKLKLESLRARNRSRNKYEDFEHEIKKLKDKVRQKDKFIADLRKDIARSEVDCEEWKELASRSRYQDRGPKRVRRY